ncbi:hypothetical protein V6N13_076670 [Hibiscus sabdariffa]
MASPFKADFSFLSRFNHPFLLRHFQISHKSCLDEVSVVSISSSEGHRRSFLEIVMDRGNGWQKVAAERDCDEHDQCFGDDPPFSLKIQY